MNSEDILWKVLAYLDDEYKQFYYFIQRQKMSTDAYNFKRKIIDYNRKCTIDRGMGVVMFVQSLGVKYDDIKKPYDNFKERIDKLARSVVK